MPHFRVLYTDRGDYAADFRLEQPLYDAIGAEIVDARLDHNAIDWDVYEAHLAQADALVCFRMPVDRRALDAAPRLKVAVRSGVGYENFDLPAFAERGIPACNVPDYGSEEVAVHALALVLALRRQVVFLNASLREGYWRGWPGGLPMWRLTNQTAGVIGLGQASAVLVIQTNAPAFVPINANVIDGSIAQAASFGPAVPEPASLALVGLGVMALLRRRA